MNGVYDINLSQKNHLERVKIGGIFLIGSVWITEFPITLASASVQKCPKKMSLPMCSSGRQGFFNNLILNVYLKRLELIKIVMRAQKGVMLGAQSSSETPQQHVQTCQFRPQPVDTRCAAQLNFEWSFCFFIIYNDLNKKFNR